ncbi:MAG: hypothetical protein ACKVTZ_08130 [Bacteroidia bacterium]
MRFNVLIIGLLLSLSACFNTRPIEPPDSNNSAWVSPTDYEILLSNFKTAIQSGNIQNYLRCLKQETYRFTPAPAVFNGHESVWQNWRNTDEQTYFNSVLANIGSANISLSFSDVQIQGNTTGNDSLKYLAKYSLTVPHTKTNLPKTFKGQIQLVIQLNLYNECEITRWADVETAKDSSWSGLKLGFVQ